MYRCFFYDTKTDSKTFYLAEQVIFIVFSFVHISNKNEKKKKGGEREREDDRYKKDRIQSVIFINMLFLFVFLLSLINGQQQTRPCGTMQSYFSADSRIVGGETASAFAWPWQVYITSQGQFKCGGTLIDRQHIVTAGHCIIGVSSNVKDFLVRVGAHNMVQQGYYSGTFYRVDAIFVNENYVSAEYGYDIAIMRLARPVDLSDTVNVICLPPSANFKVPLYVPVVITGFGLTSEDGSLPYTLQQAIIQLLPNCGDAYSSFNSATQVCAGLPDGGKDTCQGRREMDMRRGE